MSMNFDDLKAAGKMRDVIERIAAGVVTRMRPDERIGRVHHFDPGLQFAWVLFPGDTAPDGLVKARIGLDKIPVKDITTYGDQADVVRVLGKPGNYWVADFVSGVPKNPDVATGAIMIWEFAVPPTGWLIMNGQSTAGYPALAALYGANLPDRRGMMLIGAGVSQPSGANRALGSTGGADQVTLVSANLAQHAHGMNAHTHDATAGVGTLATQTSTHAHDLGSTSSATGTATGQAARGTATNSGTAQFSSAGTGSHNHTVQGHTDVPNTPNTETTPTSAATAHENMPPYAAVNFIVKT